MSDRPHHADPSGSLTRTIASSDLTSVGIDVAEVALDSLLKEGALKDLPIISALVGLWKTGATLRDFFLIRRVLSFLSGVSPIPEKERRRIMELLQEDNAAENVGEKLLTLLDRFESPAKARLLARAFTLLVAGTITRDEFWRLSFVLDRLPLSDVLALREWRTLDLNEVEHVRKHLYVSVGLGWFVMDWSSMGFQWQEQLCSIISDHLLRTS